MARERAMAKVGKGAARLKAHRQAKAERMARAAAMARAVPLLPPDGHKHGRPRCPPSQMSSPLGVARPFVPFPTPTNRSHVSPTIPIQIPSFLPSPTTDLYYDKFPPGAPHVGGVPRGEYHALSPRLPIRRVLDLSSTPCVAGSPLPVRYLPYRGSNSGPSTAARQGRLPSQNATLWR